MAYKDPIQETSDQPLRWKSLIMKTLLLAVVILEPVPKVANIGGSKIKKS